jgi:carboxylesterase
VEVRAGAESFQGGDGDVGVLLCHGFTGTPASLRPWAEYLAGEGFRVSLPRLPGHGTSWQELNQTGWPDWYAAVDRAFGQLDRSCRTVAVGGLSMGGALAALWFAAKVFKVGLLMFGKPPDFKTLVRWVRMA